MQNFAFNLIYFSRQLQQLARIVLTIAPITLTDIATGASLGNLDMWYDEAPINMGAGSMSWKGKVSIALQQDDSTGAISGKGSFPYTMKGKAGPCALSCKATSPMTIDGIATNAGYNLNVIAGATQSRCTATCPRAKATRFNRGESEDSSIVVIPNNSPNPVRLQLAGGPALNFQMKQPCPADSSRPQSVVAEVMPGPGKWAETWLELLTLDDVRSRGQPEPNRFGYTAHGFAAKMEVVDHTEPASQGKGFCYWVERVSFSFDPIEIAIPGLNYGKGTCEHTEIRKHEKKHVTSYKMLLSQFAVDINRLVGTTGLPPPAVPVHIKNRNDRSSDTKKKLQESLDKLHDKYLRLRDERNAKIDSAAEYAAVRAACPGGWR